jgi:hypothetical protein
MTYNYWITGEPAEWTSQNCGLVINGNGYDYPCDYAAEYICEFP